jgi:small subunit ribosomal protein S2
MQKLSISDMLEAGVHFGHKTRYWNPKMAQYIFGIRQGVHIINLDETLKQFQKALNFISEVAAKNGKILFVGTKKSAQTVIHEEAVRCGMPYVDYRWLGGMLTNYKTIRQSIKHFQELEELRDGPKFEQLSKKEMLNIIKEIGKLEHNLGGIKNMGGLPDAIFVVDTGHEHIAIKEANKLSIPIIGIVDTNHDPSEIEYAIPGNDDAMKAIRYYAHNIAEVIISARVEIVKAAAISAEKAEGQAKKEGKGKKKEEPKKVMVQKIAKKDVEYTKEEAKEELEKPKHEAISKKEEAESEIKKTKVVKIAKAKKEEEAVEEKEEKKAKPAKVVAKKPTKAKVTKKAK